MLFGIVYEKTIQVVTQDFACTVNDNCIVSSLEYVDHWRGRNNSVQW